MNEKDFKHWLTELGAKYREKGITTLLELSPEEFLLLEDGFNKLLITDPPAKFDDWVRLRYLFRIVLKFHHDLDKGLLILKQQI